MGRGITEKDKMAVAYAIGRTRQNFNISVGLIFINILLMLIVQSPSIGFNIAMLIICIVSSFAHNATIKRLESTYAVSEEELVKGLQ